MTDPVVPPEPDAGDPRPWEEPGAGRKDAAPHRSPLLGELANASLACGIAALVLGAPAVRGVPLAITPSAGGAASRPASDTALSHSRRLRPGAGRDGRSPRAAAAAAWWRDRP
jgi:hypothetical protein